MGFLLQLWDFIWGVGMWTGEGVIHFWVLLTRDQYIPLWTAMAPLATFIAATFIWVQIRHGVKSADVNLVFSLRDCFWSDSMVEVRKKTKSEESIDWLKKLRNGDDSIEPLRVYSVEHTPRFTVLDFFESIGTLYRRNRRLLKLIYPLMGGDILFQYKLHEDFYGHPDVKCIYPEQNFKFLAEACIKINRKKQIRMNTFEDLASNV